MAKTAEPKPSSDPDLSEAQAEQKVERPVNNLESKGDQKDEENDVEPSALKVSTSPSDEVYKIEPKPTDNTLSIASCEPDNQDKPESRAGQQLTVPLTIDLKARTQSAPTMNTSSMGIPASDSASIASIPLGLDISGVSNADQKGNGEPSAPCQQPPDVSSLTPPQLESKPLPPVVLSRTQSQPEQLQSVSLPILEQANPEPVQPIRPQHIKEEGQQVVQQPQLQANPEPMQPIPPQNIEGGQAMQQPQLQANQEPAQPITPQHIEEGGQVVQQPQLLVGGQVVQQPQLLVAVPLQQPSNEGMQQNLEQSTTTSTGAQVYAQQTQQRVYCQFPGVVTLPVTQTTEGQASMPCTTSQPNAMLQQEVPTGLHQPNLAQLQIQRVHSQEQVIGMVGAIPIVKIQAPQQQPVKRKKGRFKLLQETPSVAIGIANNTTSAGVAASTAAVASSPNTAQQPPTNAPIPINISVPASQGQSMTSAVSQLSLNIPNPQTFDGTSAPRVKKMGRFVVSNVKDPTSIPMAIQPQQGQSPAAMPTEQSVQQQVQQNQQISMNQNQTLQPTQYTHVQNQPPNQQMAGQHARSLSVPTNFVDTQPFPMVLTIAEPQTLTSYSALGVVQQQQIPQASPARGQQLPPLPPQQLPSDNLSQTQVSASKSTPPSTPGGSMPNNFVESPMRSKLVTNMQNVPLPKIPQSAEKQKAVNGGVPKKKAAQNRGGKLPQTIGSNGVLSSVGLGKVFYFLEQMKVEVTEADRIIKTLQTDMKLLVSGLMFEL